MTDVTIEKYSVASTQDRVDAEKQLKALIKVGWKITSSSVTADSEGRSHYMFVILTRQTSLDVME